MKKEKNMNKAIIKRSYKGIEEDLIYRNTAVGYYFPLENTVSVYDRETDNVIVEEGMAYPGEPRSPETRRYTVSPTVLDRIRKAIVKSDVLNIKSFESSEFCVCDGEYNCFYFSAGGKRKYIDCDNFYLLYKGCTKDSNAGKVMRLIDRIDDILDKENCD